MAAPSWKIAEALYRVGNYDNSKQEYLGVIKSLVGDGLQVPLTTNGGVVSEIYASLPEAKQIELMICCNGIAECELRKNNRGEAFLWLEEVHIVYINARHAQRKQIYDWTEWYPENPAFALQFAKSKEAACTSFLAIGNTATAIYRRWSAENTIPSSLMRQEREIATILQPGKSRALFQFRHPDPVLVAGSRANDPRLQVLGSWQKLKVKRTGGPGRRMGFSSFIWDGHLYIAGGRKDSLGPFYRDIFILNLERLDGWRPLAPYPRPTNETSAFLGWHIIPCPPHRKAYLFTGRPVLDFFDLTTKIWGSTRTKFIANDPADKKAGLAKWPYPKNQLTDSTQQILDEKLYVFGGTHGTTSIGCNLFMVLDLKTMEWRRLSGTVMNPQEADNTIPGPRKTPNSWVDTTGKRFYVIFGECDRMGAALSGEPHGGECGHAYDDFWSWDIVNGGWRRERMVGNVPCARSETALVYNPFLNKTIVWGGYNADLPTDHVEHRTSFGFSYFADTFLLEGPPSGAPQTAADEDTPRPWRQILTKGFPTYRAQSHLLVDPQTGRTYLFGGFTNGDYVPARHTAISQAFGDLWELKINIPGGHFEGVDVDDESKTAAMGPWQRCFTCGSAGQWKKCGGSCRGRAFFCEQDCLREGWKDHKAAHGCRKLEGQ